MKSEQDIRDMIKYRNILLEDSPEIVDKDIVDAEIELLEFILR